MATSFSTIGINIQYGADRITVHVGKKERVSAVIARAIKELKLDDSKIFALLHEGNALPNEATAETAVLPARTTVFFLQLTNEIQIRGASTKVIKLENTKDEKYGYCNICKDVCRLRPILRCAKCLKDTFALSQDLDYFDEESLFNAAGICTTCGDTKPKIEYLCKGCEKSTAPFLRLLRDNIHQLLCMKCGKKQDQVFKFPCSSQHTLCFKCFDYFCTIMLSRNRFKIFHDSGFSIACPGPGPDCPSAPILDPHHFYIVGQGNAFYKKYTDESFKEWKPPGDNIVCGHCSMEVDVSQGEVVEVERPAADVEQTIVSGSAWMFWKRLFSRPPPPPPVPQTRKKVPCFKCQRQYCCVCKKMWHEGDCVIVNEEEVHEFAIDPDKAEASCWHDP